MRPPECAVCGEEFTAPDGRLVTFAERDSDRQWRERVAAERMVGHPPNVDWFCGVHAEAAVALAGETIDVALTELKRQTADGVARAPEADGWPNIVKVPIAPTDIELVLSLFTDLMPAIVGDIDAVPSTTSRRNWTPMDGAQPPWCPFDDVDVTTLSGPLATAALTWDRAMWNDDAPARRTAQLTVTPVDADEYSVSATVGSGFDGTVGSSATHVLLLGTPGPDLQGLLDELASDS